MPKINKTILIVVIILAASSPFFLKYLSQEKVQVKTAEAALRDITQSISYSGSIESYNRVKIGSEIVN